MMNDLALSALEEKLEELKRILDYVRPKTASQSESMEFFEMQIYILGFTAAMQIVYKNLDKKDE